MRSTTLIIFDCVQGFIPDNSFLRFIPKLSEQLFFFFFMEAQQRVCGLACAQFLHLKLEYFKHPTGLRQKVI